MQTERACPECGSDDAEYRFPTRHRAHYTCARCGTDYAVDMYA